MLENQIISAELTDSFRQAAPARSSASSPRREQRSAIVRMCAALLAGQPEPLHQPANKDAWTSQRVSDFRVKAASQIAGASPLALRYPLASVGRPIGG
jgi:hypothetical protein